MDQDATLIQNEFSIEKAKEFFIDFYVCVRNKVDDAKQRRRARSADFLRQNALIVLQKVDDHRVMIRRYPSLTKEKFLRCYNTSFESSRKSNYGVLLLIIPVVEAVC